MLIFSVACNEREYQKIDNFFGFQTDSLIVEADTSKYAITEGDTLAEFEPFVVKPYNSVNTAKKALKIKEKVLGKKDTPIPQTKVKVVNGGWRKKPELNRAFEEQKAFAQARKELAEIYKGLAPPKKKRLVVPEIYPKSNKKTANDSIK